MTNTKRILSLALAVLMAMSLLLTVVSCGNAGDEDDTGKGAQSSTEADSDSAYQQLEKEKYNRDFSILIREDCVDDFVVEGMKGDVLGDSLYERNTVVAEDYGIDFVFNYQGKNYTAINEIAQTQDRKSVV